jgi:hypothetical protein
MEGQQQPGYKVLSRRSAAFILLALLLIGAFAVLTAQQLTEAWLVEFQARLDSDPELAIDWLRDRLIWLFLLLPVVLTAGAAVVVWQGVQVVRTGFMPPAGAWIVAGQRTHAGRAARIRGHLQWILGVLLVVTAWVGCWFGYRLVEQLLTPLAR